MDIIKISDDIILVAFPDKDGVITEVVELRGGPQLVTRVEDDASHESEEQLETVGRGEETYYRVQNHAGRDDHGGDGGHLRGVDGFVIELQNETSGEDPTPVQLFPETDGEDVSYRE